MAQFPLYSFVYIEQIQWYELFKDTLLEKIQCIYDDYNYYCNYPTNPQLNKTYNSIVDTMREVNQYVSNVTQYIRLEEQLYPGITHKKTLTFLLQIANEINSHKKEVNSIHSKLSNLYMSSQQVIAIPIIEQYNSFFLNEEQEGFCIH
jgi:hypothetical protein